MANIKSAEKRIHQAEQARLRNRSNRSRMRSQVKRLRERIAAGDAAGAQALLAETASVIDATAKKGAIHRNAADRAKSRLARTVRRLS